MTQPLKICAVFMTVAFSIVLWIGVMFYFLVAQIPQVGGYYGHTGALPPDQHLLLHRGAFRADASGP
jgi:hypothetical protein